MSQVHALGSISVKPVNVLSLFHLPPVLPDASVCLGED